MRRGAIAFVVLEVVLLAAVPVLGWAGFRTVLDTTAGEAVDPQLDPSEPGYEAFVEPTPTALAVGVDADGALSWLAFLALGAGDEHGGSIVLVPVGVLVEGPEGDDVTLAALWAGDDGEPAAVAATADVLGAGFTEHIVLDPTRVAELVAPVTPLPLTLPDDVPGFDMGAVELAPEQVAELLVTRAPEETDLARLARHETVWRAWLGAVAASPDPNAVPGESATGIGRFLRGLAAGPSTVETAPVRVADDVDDAEAYVVDREELQALVEERVPFPVAPHPGARPRVRVLDGVGVEHLALRVARDVVRAGGQVTVLGNADRFDATESRVVYFDPAVEAIAREIAAELGVGEVTQGEGPNPNDLVDLTIVVGSDLADAYGLSGG